MKRWKMIALLMCLAMSLSLFAGCGTAGQEPEPTETPEATEPAVQPEDGSPDGQGDGDDVSEPPKEELEAAVTNAVPGSAAIEALAAGEIDQSCVLPLVEDETVLSYWCSTNFGRNATITSWNEHHGLAYAQERTGVTLEIQECSMTIENERFGMMLASNDLCDIIVGFEAQYSGGVDNAIDEALVINLLDYIDSAPVYSQLLEADPG